MLQGIKKIWPPFFLLASLIFIGRYFYNQADRLDAILHLAPVFLAIAAMLQLIYWFMSVRCWQRIVILSAHKTISFMQGFKHLALLTLGKYFPGKIWGMVARSSLMKQQGIALHQSAHATFYEQSLLLHASGLVSAFLLHAINPSRYTFSLCILAAASVILIVPLQRMVFGLLVRLAKKSWRQELQETTPFAFRPMIGLLAGYSIVWLVIGLMFSCIYFALFPAAPTLLMIMRLVLANTIGITLGFFAVFSPGGLGVREAITTGLLASQLSLEDALVLSLVFRLWIVISEMLNGIVLLVPHKAGTGGAA